MADARINPFKPITGLVVGEIAYNNDQIKHRWDIKTDISPHVTCPKLQVRAGASRTPLIQRQNTVNQILVCCRRIKRCLLGAGQSLAHE